MLQKLMLDPKQEILDIIHKNSWKYQYIQPYVSFDDQGQVKGCCINGLVMLSMGWRPTKEGWARPDGGTWETYATKMRDMYGPNIITEINDINQISLSWQDGRDRLAKLWEL